MDRGLRAAPAACTILLLGVWLLLHRVAAEVVHFGPLLLKVDEDSTVTKNASVPEERVQDVYPVTISSNDLAPSETIAHQLPDSQPVIEPTRTPWPLSDDVVLSPSLSTSSLLSLASVLGDLATTQLSEMYDARSDTTELYSGVYITTSSVALEQSVNMASQGPIEDDVTVPPPDTFYQTPWATETLPIFIEDGEAVTSSFTLKSTKSGQPPTDFYFGSSIEVSMVSRSTPAISATSWPATPVESIMPSMTDTQEVTSTATKYPLSSIFSDLGFLTLQDSTTSPNEAISVTSPLYETSYFHDPEISSSSLQSSVPTDISEMWSTTGTDVTYTQWWSEDYVETISIQTSGFPGDLLPTSLITSQKTSLVDVLDSVLSSLPTPFVSSLYTDLTDSSVLLTNIVDSTEVLATLVSSVPSSENETRWVSLLESTIMPSLLISSITSIHLDNFSTTEISSPYLIKSSIYEPLNTVEAPAFVPTESGMYFPPTASLSVESKYFTLVSTLDPDGLFSSSVEEMAVSSSPLASSHVSAYEPQDSSSVLSISKSMFSTPLSEFYSTTIRETISMEVMPLNSTSFPSPSSVDWTENFSSEFTEFWGSTIMTSSVFYTSSTGATSLLPLPSSSALNATTYALPASSFGFDHTISALVEEVLPTSLFTLVQSMTLSPESDSSRFFTSLFSVTTLVPPDFTAAPSMPPTSAISLESTVDYVATASQTSTYPTSTVSVPWSSQPSSSPVFLPTTPQTSDVQPSPSPTQPVTTIGAITRPSADPSPSQSVTTVGTTASPSAHFFTTLPITTTGTTASPSAHPSPTLPTTTTGTTASPSAHPSPTLPVTTTGTTASPSAHPSPTLPTTTTGTTASPSAHPSPTLPVTTTGTTASPSAHPSPTLPVTTTGTTASPSAHPSPTLPVTTTGTTASPSAQPFTTNPPSSSTPAAITHNILDTTTPQVTTTTIITLGATTVTSTLTAPVTPPSGLTATTTVATTRPSFVCDVSNPEPYLVTVVLSRGSNIENVTETIKKTLTVHFNRSVELEVFSMADSYSFMVTSGPLVYTAIAVDGVLSGLVMGRFPPILSLQTTFMGIDLRFHVQTVLQFVPQSVDIRLCTFSEQMQKGLTLALSEARRLRQESANFTVQVVNISASRLGSGKAPVTVTYAVRERGGFINGSDVSGQLRNLSLVEFSFFLGFPVKQIAEPSTYPQLDISPLLKDSWLRTILLGVQEQQLQDETFQTEMERKLAQIISEATSQKRRWKRASYAGSTTVQVVNVSRLDGQDDPVQLVYFIEDQYGVRLAADKASSLINEVNIQRAAIILGYRLQGVVAQPLNQPAEADRQAQNLWIIVGVAVPVLVVTVIIVILYWKLCRTDKLDFQPDTISNLQQRQKQLQAPNVKGFDFAKQHLGQHNKDEVLVVHEPPPPVLHGPLKDSTPSENGDIPTPRSKCSTKPNKIGRHRSRVTPSDAGSTASEPSSGKESGEEGPRPSAPPQETRLRPTGKGEIPALGSGPEQHSSASIFEHVDRMSRSSEASRRLPSKIQLIAMQPMAALPMHGLSTAEREVEANKIQTTLRHKSEIEHHRNKIRLRAKRKGHYEFPLVDVVGMTDTKERQRMYRRAQMQFDKILDPVLGVPTVFIEPRKSSRSRRSPKPRRKQQGSTSPPDADRDRLITTDSEGTYKRPPGVSNSAYVSDPDIPSDNPTPVSELGQYPGSPPRLPAPHLPAPHLPAPYVAPQPSIEEVRQTMQSLLDDAFALVAPSSQGPGGLQAGNTSGQHAGISSSARSGQGSAPWPYPSHQSSHYNRFLDFGGPQPTAPSLMTRSPGFGSGFLPPAETATESQQAEGQYPGRMYPEDLTSVARPRPLGSNSGPAQIHQLTQVGIASRMGAQSTELAPSRSVQGFSGPVWPSYYSHEEETPRNAAHREAGHTHGAQDYSGPQMFSVNRGPNRQPGSHLPPSICYPSSSAEDVHPGHSSASLIKAIREELLRLSQKQVVAPTYHS
ncbi:UPF0606 protein KIAA1549 homolog isoform X3 [Ranitomeya imitator]|uniref:UPF0606 protein KIAA1549 homolog isoform X3 n=1 Tax=Ranitomeya imitator TaxID=111125 RepID=UPI0037E733AB